MRFAPLVLLLVVEAAFAQTPDPKETPKGPADKAAARKEPEGTSWKSKQVVSKLGAIRMKRVLMIDEDGNPVYEWFQGLQISYVVRDDQGNQVLLRRFDGVEGWAQKSDLVPVKEAVAYFTKVIAEDPDKAAFNHRLRAAAQQLNGETDAALTDITEAIRLDPMSYINYHHRANYWTHKKDLDKALADLETGLQLKSDYAPMIQARAGIRIRKKDYGEAVKDFEEILKANERNVSVLNSLAWLLSTCPDGEVRDGRRSVSLAEQAVALTQRKNGMYLDTLAAAYAEVGRFDDAVRVQEEALRDRDFLLQSGNEGSERVDLYRQRKAYRQK